MAGGGAVSVDSGGGDAPVGGGSHFGLPEGEVTFCFTDIEGSTRLARRLGPDWRRVLERHNALLRDVWRRHDGVEVKTEGDAFFVAFGDAVDAVAAAVDAHRALAAEQWTEGVELRVRIGMHTGVAEVSEGDYVGFEVHKAARVAAAGHGGQILLSGATSDLVATQLPPETSLQPLGVFSLKDFEEGERLVRVTHPDLEGNDLAPAAVPVAAHNLPLLRTSFVGRDVERVEVAKLCEHLPLVTILGPGGAGKTRLALEVGRTVASDYPDGVWAVLLAGESADTDIAAVVAAAMGVADVGGVSVLEALTRALRAKRLLLILDNCEHVVDATAEVVDAILSSCSDVAVLATSRQPLEVEGERVWSMPMLGLPTPGAATWAAVAGAEAAELFADRAAAADPSFSFSDATADAVGRICTALDGLPLAIELAAAAARSIPLATLASRLEEGTSLLRSSSRSLAPRQRTIDDLIGWSYDLLDERQQAVFRRLAVFRGGWTAEAAEGVCAHGDVTRGEVLSVLAELADRSLVVVDSDERYRMLVLIRGFAQARLESSGEAETARAAHLAHFVRVAADIVEAGSSQPASLRLARTEMENLRAALSHAAVRGDERAWQLVLAMGDALIHQGLYRIFDEVLVEVEPVVESRADLHSRVHANRAQMARVLGDAEAASELADAALERAEASGDGDLVAAVASQKAHALYALGEFEHAAAVAERHVATATSPLRRAQLLEAQALAIAAVRDDDGVMDLRLEAARLYDEAGASVRAATLRIESAQAVARTDAAAGLRAIDDGLALADLAEVPRLRAAALLARARLVRDHVPGTDRASAVRDLDEAIDIAEALGEPLMTMILRTERAVARARDGDRAGAAADVVEAMPAILAFGHDTTTADILSVAACVLVDGAAAPALASAALALGASDRDLVEPLRELALGHEGDPPSAPAALQLAAVSLAASLSIRGEPR